MRLTVQAASEMRVQWDQEGLQQYKYLVQVTGKREHCMNMYANAQLWDITGDVYYQYCTVRRDAYKLLGGKLTQTCTSRKKIDPIAVEGL